MTHIEEPQEEAVPSSAGQPSPAEAARSEKVEVVRKMRETIGDKAPRQIDLIKSAMSSAISAKASTVFMNSSTRMLMNFATSTPPGVASVYNILGRVADDDKLLDLITGAGHVGMGDDAANSMIEGYAAVVDMLAEGIENHRLHEIDKELADMLVDDSDKFTSHFTGEVREWLDKYDHVLSDEIRAYRSALAEELNWEKPLHAKDALANYIGLGKRLRETMVPEGSDPATESDKDDGAWWEDEDSGVSKPSAKAKAEGTEALASELTDTLLSIRAMTTASELADTKLTIKAMTAFLESDSPLAIAAGGLSALPSVKADKAFNHKDGTMPASEFAGALRTVMRARRATESGRGEAMLASSSAAEPAGVAPVPTEVRPGEGRRAELVAKLKASSLAMLAGEPFAVGAAEAEGSDAVSEDSYSDF